MTRRWRGRSCNPCSTSSSRTASAVSARSLTATRPTPRAGASPRRGRWRRCYGWERDGANPGVRPPEHRGWVRRGLIDSVLPQAHTVSALHGRSVRACSSHTIGVSLGTSAGPRASTSPSHVINVAPRVSATARYTESAPRRRKSRAGCAARRARVMSRGTKARLGKVSINASVRSARSGSLVCRAMAAEHSANTSVGQKRGSCCLPTPRRKSALAA
jgi:hypothetical protein